MDVSGSRSVNHLCEHEFNVQAAKTVGDNICSATAGIYVAANTCGYPGMMGVFTALRNESTNVVVELSKSLQYALVLSFNFGTEIFNDGKHFVGCDAKYSFINTVNGRKLTHETFGFEYRHARGHSAHLALSQVGKFNACTLDLLAKTNLWSSPDKATNLELSFNAMCRLDSLFAGMSKFGGGLRLVHHF